MSLKIHLAKKGKLKISPDEAYRTGPQNFVSVKLDEMAEREIK